MKRVRGLSWTARSSALCPHSSWNSAGRIWTATSRKGGAVWTARCDSNATASVPISSVEERSPQRRIPELLLVLRSGVDDAGYTRNAYMRMTFG
ncbi:hypothetical protein IE81DRAFT_134035 [Ceraceosorus guamensis]|uniref:Uncharacterized protein n=1 Tax=Ceraceosorus guamensis TaxID=1522189 RepID=A0A316VY00_9BASI|nr:hypothetical protein IE81DRAFT_134035 [Ceraceosorus guamensis]PWN42360.1 hypothetical protein IE81DRAFT_134035 [Ceraceosorus guamensis]